MCLPCAEAARQRAALLNPEGIVPVEQRFNITPVRPILESSMKPFARPQVTQGDVVPVNKGPITIPHDTEQMKQKKAQAVDTGSKLAITTINKPD